MLLLVGCLSFTEETFKRKLINKEWELVAFEDTIRFYNVNRNAFLKPKHTHDKYLYFDNYNKANAFWDKHSQSTMDHLDCKWSIDDSIIKLNFDLFSFDTFQNSRIPIRFKILELTDHTLELRNLDSPDSLNFYILMYNEYNSMFNQNRDLKLNKKRI
jgi:hypothetical protein